MGALANMNAALRTDLKELHLPTIRALYESYAAQAQQESLSYEQYLFELVEKECEERRNNRINRWVRESKLPLEKTLETFDRSRLSRKLNQQVNALLKGNFLKNTENVLAFGNPGSGKTHLLAAIARELIREGHRVYFRSCDLLVQDLLIAKQELRLSRLIKNLAKYEALFLDDIGYVQHNRDEMEVLFTLLAERYERGSVMITSNLAFSQWERIFKDPMTTAAVIDRLVHHSVILELNLPSYRMQTAAGRKKNDKNMDPGE
ncbi:MAG TPA: IS21-like element helper ATPase IstB [bacterium]|nr:IS21-like element helper ATPase IstB [bacterium]